MAGINSTCDTKPFCTSNWPFGQLVIFRIIIKFSTNSSNNRGADEWRQAESMRMWIGSTVSDLIVLRVRRCHHNTAQCQRPTVCVPITCYVCDQQQITCCSNSLRDGFSVGKCVHIYPANGRTGRCHFSFRCVATPPGFDAHNGYNS